MGSDVLFATRQGVDIKNDNMYRVILHNDDSTPMDVVVLVLYLAFKKQEKEAVDLMLAAHIHGRAIIDTLPKKLATARQAEAMKVASSFGCVDFKITLEEDA